MHTTTHRVVNFVNRRDYNLIRWMRRLLWKLLGHPAFLNPTPGSAFARLADADTSLKEAKGKLIAIQDSLAVKADQASSLADAAADAHAEHDKLDGDLKKLHALLG